MDLSISSRRHWNDPKSLQKPLLAELERNHCRPLTWHKSNKGAWLSTKFMNLWCRSRGECVLVVSPYANFWPIHTGGRLVVWDRKSHCEPRWWKQEKSCFVFNEMERDGADCPQGVPSPLLLLFVLYPFHERSRRNVGLVVYLCYGAVLAWCSWQIIFWSTSVACARLCTGTPVSALPESP